MAANQDLRPEIRDGGEQDDDSPGMHITVQQPDPHGGPGIDRGGMPQPVDGGAEPTSRVEVRQRGAVEVSADLWPRSRQQQY